MEKKEIERLKEYNKDEYKQKVYWHDKYYSLVNRLKMVLDLSGELEW